MHNLTKFTYQNIVKPRFFHAELDTIRQRFRVSYVLLGKNVLGVIIQTAIRHTYKLASLKDI